MANSTVVYFNDNEYKGDFMKVLLQIRENYLSHRAGDSIIFLNIKKSLRKLGLEVDVSTDDKMSLKEYDIIHIFNTVRVNESVRFMQKAKRNNKKVVLTPMYWDLNNYYKKTRQYKKLNRWLENEEKRKYLFENCDIFLPHCEGAAALINTNYGSSTPFEIVPFGVETSFLNGEKHYLDSKYGVDNYILCVGRINQQKNQLGLIKSLSKENIPLVLVGSISDRKYYQQCIEAGNKNVFILDEIKRSELNSIYKSAKVHVLPSWLEYPGVATLEAGLSGCNVVTTDLGSTKEVFKEFVRYCKPHSQESIYRQTMDAFESRKNNDFRDFILENYTWMKSAMKIKEIYDSLI